MNNLNSYKENSVLNRDVVLFYIEPSVLGHISIEELDRMNKHSEESNVKYRVIPKFHHSKDDVNNDNLLAPVTLDEDTEIELLEFYKNLDEQYSNVNFDDVLEYLNYLIEFKNFLIKIKAKSNPYSPYFIEDWLEDNYKNSIQIKEFEFLKFRK
jgi:hypothetical protein